MGASLESGVAFPDSFVLDGRDARRLASSDLTWVRALDEDPRVTEFFGGVRDAARSAAYVVDGVAHWREYGVGPYLVFDAGDLVGRCALRHTRRAGERDLEVSYALAPSYWGRGIATGLVEHLCELATRHSDAHVIHATVLEGNVRSSAVLERTGFVRVADVERDGHTFLAYERALVIDDRATLPASMGDIDANL